MPKQKRFALRAKIPLDRLQPGPIRHWTLPDSLVARIIDFKQTLGEMDPSSIDKTIEDFCRDAHPEREIAVWEGIAAVYQDALARDLSMTFSQKKKVYLRLLGASLQEHPITATSDDEEAEAA